MEESPNARVPSVLLVEDDPSLREAITRALARRGFDVIAAASGEEALERAGALSPDAVVMDVFLPDAGGLGVAHALRRRASFASVPVLFITGLAIAAVRAALAPAPVLFKPFSARQLVSSLEAITRTAA